MTWTRLEAELESVPAEETPAVAAPEKPYGFPGGVCWGRPGPPCSGTWGSDGVVCRWADP